VRGVVIGFLLAAAVAAGAALTSAHAFEDSQFCLAIREMTRSAADVGTWQDRVTRNDGIEISCERKLVHFKRYYSVSAGALQGPWKERKAQEWEGATCNRSLWREAIDNGWIISATLTMVTGERLWLSCLPGGRAFHRAIP
jgi:uncharacterized protein with NRDE domain